MLAQIVQIHVVIIEIQCIFLNEYFFNGSLLLGQFPYLFEVELIHIMLC